MKKTILNLSVLVGLSVLLTGCATQRFVPKQLNDNARGIATTRTTPYGCVVLGDVEGRDSIPARRGIGLVVGNTQSAVREGAMNDLRNNAVDVVGNTKNRTVLSITYEKAYCIAGTECPKEQLKNENMQIDSYLVKGAVFECGSKDK